MKYKLKQCTMRKPVDGGYTERISYIPEKFAKLNKIIQLKDDDVWSDGWEVVHVGGEITSDEVVQTEMAHKKHRKHSDI